MAARRDRQFYFTRLSWRHAPARRRIADTATGDVKQIIEERLNTASSRRLRPAQQGTELISGRSATGGVTYRMTPQRALEEPAHRGESDHPARRDRRKRARYTARGAKGEDPVLHPFVLRKPRRHRPRCSTWGCVALRIGLRVESLLVSTVEVDAAPESSLYDTTGASPRSSRPRSERAHRDGLQVPRALHRESR
jgi:hypothetical protein